MLKRSWCSPLAAFLAVGLIAAAAPAGHFWLFE